MEEILKAETKRVIWRIDHADKEISKVKQLIVQEKKNFEYKIEDPTGGLNKESEEKTPPSNVRKVLKLKFPPFHQ